MTRGKKVLVRWMLAAVTAGALLGGTASAELPECIKVYACGCSSDGGYIYCSEYC
jgi:hypothetical protein